MTIARKHIVNENSQGFYHCTNRCVRRTFLCGIDELTGFDYSHRKAWLEKRLFELCELFSIDVFAYAIMDNHYHLVLHVDPLAPESWSDEEVIERWVKAYSQPDSNEFSLRNQLKKQAILSDREKLKEIRKRLGSLSWFMGRLNEPLAKKSNLEESCTGRFWEGRFHSQALLDEAAVLSCMAYVDLNPIRADIAQTLEGSRYTSIRKRIEEVKKQTTPKLREQLSSPLQSMNQNANQNVLPIQLKEYIQLIEWTGQNILYSGKSSLPLNLFSTLNSLNLQQNNWITQIKDFNNHYCHVVGSIDLIREKATTIKKRWLKGVKSAMQFYQNKS